MRRHLWRKRCADSLYSALGGLFDGFESTTENTTESLLENLKAQVRGVTDWKATLETLEKRGISGDLLSELAGTSPTSVADLELLAQMTDEQLAEYVTLWQTKTDLCKMIATDEMAGLKDDTIKQIKDLNAESAEKLQELKTTYKESAKELRTAFKKEMKALTAECIEEVGKLPNKFKAIGERSGQNLANAGIILYRVV